MEALPKFLRPLYEMIPPFPRETLEEAITRREESTPFLLQSIEEAANIKDENDDAWAELDSLHVYAYFLLAEFRETRAYEPIVRMFRNPIYEELVGEDLVSENLPRILASVCGGDLGPIKALFEDRQLDIFVRSAALESLGALVDAGLLPREELSTYLGAFFAAREPEETSGFLWDSAINLCVEHRFTEHLDTIRSLYRDGIADPQFQGLEEVEKGIALPPGESLYAAGKERPKGLIDSAIKELEWWWCFDPKSLEEGKSEMSGDRRDPLGSGGSYLPSEPYVRTEPKIGRNEPCPCGSGRKFKKCCGAAA